jgi:gluconokinase
MGVSGCGKTTLGLALAARTGWNFLDADTVHSPENIAKLRAGIALTDADRRPWLDRIASWMANHPGGYIVACSALKRRYRDRLRQADPGLHLAFLRGDASELAERLAHRPGHFFAPGLLASQLADLEEPAPDEHPITVPIGLSTEDAVDRVLAAIG